MDWLDESICFHAMKGVTLVTEQDLSAWAMSCSGSGVSAGRSDVGRSDMGQSESGATVRLCTQSNGGPCTQSDRGPCTQSNGEAMYPERQRAMNRGVMLAVSRGNGWPRDIFGRKQLRWAP
eukprot:g22335.t1